VRYVSTVTAAFVVLGAVLLAVSQTTAVIVIGLFLVRLGGQSVLPLIGSTTIGRYFDVRRGRALSLSILGISVAEVILPPLATYAMVSYGYPVVWGLAAGAVAFVFIPAVWLLIRRHDAFQRADTVADRAASAGGGAPGESRVPSDSAMEVSYTRSQVLRDRRFQLILPIVLFIPFVFTGLVFNQSVIGEERGYTPELMAYGLSAYGLVRVIFLLTGGDLVDRIGPHRLLRFSLVPAVLGLLLLLLVDAPWVIPVFFGLFGTSAGVDSVLMPALWAQRYGPRYLGSIKSTVRLFVVVASAAAPVLFSYGLGLGTSFWLLLLISYGLVCITLAWVERGLPSYSTAGDD
jgi:MFS family permease